MGLLKRCTSLQTYGLQLKDTSAVEMCTCISKVHEDSAAESAGLTVGESPGESWTETKAIVACQPKRITHAHTHTKQYHFLIRDEFYRLISGR